MVGPDDVTGSSPVADCGRDERGVRQAGRCEVVKK